MKNGALPEVVSSFDALSALPESWGHNQHYHAAILDAIRPNGGKGLDIGCGAGDFAALLAGRCGSVLGIDVSTGMIAAAERRNAREGVAYAVEAAESALARGRGAYSAIVSIASLHHMDAAEIFALAKEALAPGGVFVVLDLFKDESLADFAYSALSSVLNPIYSLAKNGRLRPSAESRRAWDEHAALDSYSSLSELRRAADAALGSYSLRRLLFWRYMLVYRKSPISV